MDKFLEFCDFFLQRLCEFESLPSRERVLIYSVQINLCKRKCGALKLSEMVEGCEEATETFGTVTGSVNETDFSSSE